MFPAATFTGVGGGGNRESDALNNPPRRGVSCPETLAGRWWSWSPCASLSSVALSCRVTVRMNGDFPKNGHFVVFNLRKAPLDLYIPRDPGQGVVSCAVSHTVLGAFSVM